MGDMAEDLNATVARVRIALIRSQVRESTTPVKRARRRSTTTAVYAGVKDGVPVFSKQRVVRVI
ncbi:hypothetical protein QBC40DRAFT_254402 [Triangularia verruculosa]|uniref:Uncharacterized protein n=1 Tax=Triangularia verruculosa TaxID=2587418 RepID=A0AAN6XGE9_9PEZI|nr:hypothetical protein QBC40DRAFT_254402 [Triangularia verruculosa]